MFALSCKCRKQASQSPEEAFISIERTACFGTCPIDVYTLYVNGHQRYEGKRFTGALSGEFSADMSEKKACKLFRNWSKIEWNMYDSIYPSGYSDLPSTIIRFQYPDVSHKIEITGDHPNTLDSLIAELSALRDQQNWEAITLE